MNSSVVQSDCPVSSCAGLVTIEWRSECLSRLVAALQSMHVCLPLDNDTPTSAESSIPVTFTCLWTRSMVQRLEHNSSCYPCPNQLQQPGRMSRVRSFHCLQPNNKCWQQPERAPARKQCGERVLTADAAEFAHSILVQQCVQTYSEAPRRLLNKASGAKCSQLCCHGRTLHAQGASSKLPVAPH